MPDDLLEFHEAVNSLQQQEEDVIEEHRELIGVRNAYCMQLIQSASCVIQFEADYVVETTTYPEFVAGDLLMDWTTDM